MFKSSCLQNWEYRCPSYPIYRTENTDVQVTSTELRIQIPSHHIKNWEYRCPSHHVYRTKNTDIQVIVSTELTIQMFNSLPLQNWEYRCPSHHIQNWEYICPSHHITKSSCLQNWQHRCSSHHVYRTENTDVQVTT